MCILKDEMVGDVFDMLMSCGDFHEFKALMLSFKKNVNVQIDGQQQEISTVS